MDRDDRRRYFVVGSVILEIVTPLFRKRLENDYTSKGIGSLQGFLNTQPVIHILFHLRHKNARCCKDNVNCNNRSSLPLNYRQWSLLYTETNPGINTHYCHCKYSANPVHTNELDITLASLILLNCCNLGPADENAICELREFKNNYLSHNAKGRITETEYNSLWTDLTTLILQLDNTKQDDLIRIERRPLDEGLCEEYVRQLVDVYQLLEEMNITIQETSGDVKEIKELLQKVIAIQESRENPAITGQGQNITPYKLGQTIFYPHQQIDLSTVISERFRFVRDGVMMDDGRLVLCLPCMKRLLIYNTDMTEVDSIQLQAYPCHVTAVNFSTVAVITVRGFLYVEMYDINNKHQLKSIPLPTEGILSSGITTINNNVFAGGEYGINIIDHQTGDVQNIYTDNICTGRVHASGDRIFYCNTKYKDNNLYCYNYSKKRITKTSLPSQPRRITSLQDCSLYAICEDKSVQHVSSDGKQYKPVTTEGLKSLKWNTVISYNPKQRKLFTCTQSGKLNIYKEK